ncbi:MAG: TPM domain-containing protein, partial [Flavobacteriaceae bacterium]
MTAFQRPKTHYIFTALLALLCLNFTVAQFEIPAKPSVQTSLYDYADILSAAEESALEQKLIRYADSTSTQIVVVNISSTNGEEINFLGANWLSAWGIGQKGVDNGILILVADQDRKVGINTGYGVESILTDALSKRIIEQRIIPEFRSGDYYRGLDSGVEAVFEVLNGSFENTYQSNKSDDLKGVFVYVVLFILVFIFLASRGGRGGPRGRRRGYDPLT